MRRPTSKRPQRGLWVAVMLGLLLVGCTQERNPYGKPDKGAISGSGYTNVFFGMTFPLPKGWHVLTEADPAKAAEAEINLIKPDSPEAKKALRQAKGKMLVLLAVAKHPLGYKDGVNPNITIGAEDITPRIDKIKNGKAYLEDATKAMKQLTRNVKEIGPIKTLAVGGKTFHQMDITLSVGDKTVYQRMSAVVIKNHILLLYTTAADKSGLDELAKILEKVAFKSEAS